MSLVSLVTSAVRSLTSHRSERPAASPVTTSESETGDQATYDRASQFILMRLISWPSIEDRM